MAFKKNRLTISLFAIVSMAIFGACAQAASVPEATATPEPTSTPVPEVKAIDIDPKADSEAFLAALPSSEVDCAASAVGGRDKLAQLVSLKENNTEGISTTQLKVLAACIGDETVQRVVLGQLNLETGGLSDATTACVTNYTAGIDFSSLFGGGQAAGQETIVGTLQSLFCLSPQERQALENSDQSIIQITELGGIDALECAVDGAGPTGLVEFGNIFSADGTVDPVAVGGFMPLLIDCGVIEDDAFEATGISSDQFACLFAALDPETLNSFLSIANDPAATPDLSSAASLLAAMGDCGLNLQDILDAAGSAGVTVPDGSGGQGVVIPDVSTDLLLCLTDNGISASLASSYAAGSTDASDPALAAALAACEGEGTGSGEGISFPDGNGGTTTIDPAMLESLPISAEQVQCLITEVGAEQLQAVAAGTESPLAILGALGTCNISISDLLAG